MEVATTTTFFATSIYDPVTQVYLGRCPGHSFSRLLFQLVHGSDSQEGLFDILVPRQDRYQTLVDESFVFELYSKDV